MRRIEIHLKDFVLHSESQKSIQRRFESQKKKRKEMRRIEIHLKDFVLHSASQKGIQRRFESQKRKEKK